MLRVAVMIAFKPGTTKEQAANALRKIQDVIDRDFYVGRNGKKVTADEIVTEYDPDREGHPTLYFP